VPISRLDDLKAEIEQTLSQRVKEPDFAEYVRHAFNFGLVEKLPEMKSIIVAAGYNPAHRVLFCHQNRIKELVLPPGFVKFYPRQIATAQSVKEVMASIGCKAERIIIPVKLLATHSGLSKYGKNNITYVKNWGSNNFLGSYLTDLPTLADPWQPIEHISACEGCEACLRSCPSGAIEADRFLINGDKCITLYNENPGEFPDWLQPDWHHAMVGCIRCQEVCPANPVTEVKTSVLDTFSAPETEIICETDSFDQLPDELKARFEAFGFAEYHHVILRNIRAALNAK
jgi:epoxyqueuosine reductase